MVAIPGVYVPIRGDLSQLNKDFQAARGIVTDASKEMSNSLNNALSNYQISKSTNSLLDDLGRLQRSSHLTGDAFKGMGVDLKDLSRITGLTSDEFKALQGRMLETKASNQQVRSLTNIAKAAGLSKAEIKELGTQFGLSTKEIKRSIENVDRGISTSGGRLKQMLTSIIAYSAGFAIFYQIINGIKESFESGLKAVNDYKLEVSETAAFITTFSEKAKQGDIVGAYKDASNYAGLLAQKLEMVDAKTIASGKDLQTITQVMIQHGVLLDVNNKKEVDGLTNIATALALVTQGQNKDIQMRQEINALLDGQMRATDRLPRLLQNIDPHLKQHLALWKQQGTIIENVGALLHGFASSTGDLDNQWVAVGSTMETIKDRVLRAGFEPVYEELIRLAKEFNTSMMDAEGNLTPMAHTIINSIHSVLAEFYRLGQFIDKIGGSLTQIGMLLYMPGDFFGNKNSQKKFDQLLKWNEEFKKRYEDSAKSLQAMANSEIGLNADGTKKLTSMAVPKTVIPPPDTTKYDAAIQKIKDRIAELSNTGGTPFLALQKGLDNATIKARELGDSLLTSGKITDKGQVSGITGEVKTLTSAMKKAAQAKYDLSLDQQAKSWNQSMHSMGLVTNDETAGMSTGLAKITKNVEKAKAMLDIIHFKFGGPDDGTAAYAARIQRINDALGTSKAQIEAIGEVSKQAFIAKAVIDENKAVSSLNDKYDLLATTNNKAARQILKINRDYDNQLARFGKKVGINSKEYKDEKIRLDGLKKLAIEHNVEILKSYDNLWLGVEAGILDVQKGFMTLGDVGYSEFNDIYKGVNTILVDGLKGDFGSIKKDFKAMLDDMLGDVIKWVAQVVERMALNAVFSKDGLLGNVIGSALSSEFGSSASGGGSNIVSKLITSYATKKAGSYLANTQTGKAVMSYFGGSGGAGGTASTALAGEYATAYGSGALGGSSTGMTGALSAEYNAYGANALSGYGNVSLGSSLGSTGGTAGAGAGAGTTGTAGTAGSGAGSGVGAAAGTAGGIAAVVAMAALIGWSIHDSKNGPTLDRLVQVNKTKPDDFAKSFSDGWDKAPKKMRDIVTTLDQFGKATYDTNSKLLQFTDTQQIASMGIVSMNAQTHKLETTIPLTVYQVNKANDGFMNMAGVVDKVQDSIAQQSRTTAGLTAKSLEEIAAQNGIKSSTSTLINAYMGQSAAAMYLAHVSQGAGAAMAAAATDAAVALGSIKSAAQSAKKYTSFTDHGTTWVTASTGGGFDGNIESANAPARSNLSYHASGGVFTDPTRIGNHVFGEAGAEILAPLPGGADVLAKMAERVNSTNKLINELFSKANSIGSNSGTGPQKLVFEHTSVNNIVLDGHIIKKQVDKVVVMKQNQGETGQVYI